MVLRGITGSREGAKPRSPDDTCPIFQPGLGLQTGLELEGLGLCQDRLPRPCRRCASLRAAGVHGLPSARAFLRSLETDRCM